MSQEIFDTRSMNGTLKFTILQLRRYFILKIRICALTSFIPLRCLMLLLTWPFEFSSLSLFILVVFLFPVQTSSCVLSVWFLCHSAYLIIFPSFYLIFQFSSKFFNSSFTIYTFCLYFLGYMSYSLNFSYNRSSCI